MYEVKELQGDNNAGSYEYELIDPEFLHASASTGNAELNINLSCT